MSHVTVRVFRTTTIFLLSLCWCIPYSSWGLTRTVSPGSATAIQDCINLAMPGDICDIKDGRYDERVNTARDGTASLPITIRSTGTATMQGFVIEHSYIRIEGMDITTDSFPTPKVPIWFSNGAILVTPSAHDIQMVGTTVRDLIRNAAGINL